MVVLGSKRNEYKRVQTPVRATECSQTEPQPTKILYEHCGDGAKYSRANKQCEDRMRLLLQAFRDTDTMTNNTS